jgi:hypothetical protein
MADTLRSNFDISNGTTAVELSTVANSATTYQTILSISLCNTSATVDHTFDIYIKDVGGAHDGGSANTLYYLYITQSLPSLSTFVHNDKIMLQSQEELYVLLDSNTAPVNSIHIITSYLEQT